MEEKKPYLFFNAFLAKNEYSHLDEPAFLKSHSQVNTYELDNKHNLTGKLFVKIPKEKSPTWKSFTENISGTVLKELTNLSSSAVLIIKTQKATMAFTFGYGRFLIDTKFFAHDFGIKTALNTLDHDSLRSVDLFTLEDQAVQKKAQAARETSIGVFGIDISRDVLRAVTGSPKPGVSLRNISGGDSVYSFAAKVDVNEISELVELLSSYYDNETYKDEFSWVDNIRRVKEKSEIDMLDSKLIDNIKLKNDSIVITIPEVVLWDKIYGFSFTRNKTKIVPIIDKNDYFDQIKDLDTISIDSLKRDRLFIYDLESNESDYQIYKSLYFEFKDKRKTYTLFSGNWYEIDNAFILRIDNILEHIKISSLEFPNVHIWDEKNGDIVKKKIETEDVYNKRTSTLKRYHLLDKKLIKSNRTTTSIELCDLMTDDRQFIHVKHRKGGSAGLSHLFAQGHVAAEILLSDREFRQQTRNVLRTVHAGLQNSVPLDNFKSEGIEIVFLILGESSESLKRNLPFFSKVNLSKTYENLSQRGFKVTISGAGTEEIQ